MSLFRKVRLLSIDPEAPEKEAIDIASGIIREGGLVAFPTETVYGIAANLTNKKTIERLYAIKKRPREKPLTIHISNMTMLINMAGAVPDTARRLIDAFWPGPLTIVMRTKNGKKTGFRMPANKIALSLIEASNVPMVAPSANLSGSRPPRNMEEVLEEMEDMVDMIIDGGQTEVGVESTVVDITTKPFTILREGAISKEKIEGALI